MTEKNTHPTTLVFDTIDGDIHLSVLFGMDVKKVGLMPPMDTPARILVGGMIGKLLETGVITTSTLHMPEIEGALTTMTSSEAKDAVVAAGHTAMDRIKALEPDADLDEMAAAVERLEKRVLKN